MPLLADVTVYGIITAFMALLLNEYKCTLPIGLNMLLLSCSIIWIRLLAFMYDRHVLRPVALVGVILGVILFVMTIIAGLVFMILVEVHEPHCVNFKIIVLNWIIIGAGNLLLIMTMVASIVLLFKYRLDLARNKATVRKVEEVYEKIMDPRYDATGFIKEHGDVLDKGRLTPNEVAIFLDTCRHEHTEDQESTVSLNSKKECSICLEEYYSKQIVVHHPLCQHVFHPDCLLPWLKNDLHCPLCKRGTRSSLILQLHKHALVNASRSGLKL